MAWGTASGSECTSSPFMLHDLYPLEETAEKGQIIATRPGSGHYHEKGTAAPLSTAPQRRLPHLCTSSMVSCEDPAGRGCAGEECCSLLSA